MDLANASQTASFTGYLEYRIATEYGYKYNFLVSYGENVGTVLQINVVGDSVDGLVFYTHSTGGVVEVSYYGKTKVISLYSEIPDVIFADMDIGSAQRIYEYGVYVLQIIFVILLTIVIYCKIQKFTRKADKLADSDVHPSLDRDSGLDLVRAVAAFLVTLVHSYFAAYDFYFPTGNESQIYGGLAELFLHWISFECVPLFVISRDICLKIRQTFWYAINHYPDICCFFCFVTVLRVVLVEMAWWKNSITLKGIIHMLFGMELAWYLEMYVGLILLIPFLNRIWASTNKKEKEAFQCVLIALTSGRYVFDSAVPDYWVGIIMRTYYFIGAYLADNPIKVTQGKTFLMFLAVIALQTTLSVTAWKDIGMFEKFNRSYNPLLVIIGAALLFSALKNIKIKNIIAKNV